MTVEQFHAYMSLFRSRSDVYARHWQKGAASGYSPAYRFNWQAFNAHRACGGTLKDFDDKQTLPLTKGVFLQHVRGELAAGVYPILPDNTCYFLTADFDGAQWLTDCQRYLAACQRAGLSAHLERSKSGKGGHVWLFFAEAYPCARARRIGLALLRCSTQSLAIGADSFDRLFPNQDALPAGGYGNLIALPLQGAATARGNTMFLHPVTEEPHADQWEYVQHIRKHTSFELDTALAQLEQGARSQPANEPTSGTLSVTVGSCLTLPRRLLTPATSNFLRDNLNFLSAEYVTKKRLGKPTYDVQKYFQLIEESADKVCVPRGFLGRLTEFLDVQGVPYKLIHHHPRLNDRSFQSHIVLRTEQERLVTAAIEHRQGIIVAPPGSGKTMVGMELIARRGKPALVLVHRKQLLDQWVERIQTYLGVPKNRIGVFSGAAKRIGADITVGLLQSLVRYEHYDELASAFGTIIVDECHHVPAKTFRTVVSRLNAEYVYGLTATPKRKHNDEQLIYAHIGDVVATMQPALPAHNVAPLEVNVHKTTLQLPFQWQTDQFELLAKAVCFDSARNQLIVADILKQVGLERKVLVLSERKEHLKIIDLYLKGQCETLLVTGDDSAVMRASKLRRARDGDYHVLLSTGQLFGEGLDVRNIEALVLAFPFSFEGKLIQYTGRLSHSEAPKALIDYHDDGVAFLDRQFKHRRRYYKRAFIGA